MRSPVDFRTFIILCLPALMFFLSEPPLSALNLGDRAERISVKTWFNGGPVYPSVSNGKTIHVLVFWATWDKNNRELAPFLNKLHEQYKDQDVVILGVSQEPASRVGLYLAGMDVNFMVAVDKGAATTRKYMKGHTGIPKAFLIDRKGTVVWVGSPLAGLEPVLRKVVKGEYDKDKMVEIRNAEEKLRRAVKTGDTESMYFIVESLLRKEPQNYRYYCIKRDILKMKNDRKRLRMNYRDMIRTFAGDPDKLLDIAVQTVSDREHNFRFPELGLIAALIARKWQPEDAVTAHTVLARIFFETGMTGRAVRAQQKAVSEASGKKKRVLKKRLTYYREIHRLKKNLEEQWTSEAETVPLKEP